MALEAAGARLDREVSGVPHQLLKGNFGNLDELLCSAEVPGVDGFLFDLGVSGAGRDGHSISLAGAFRITRAPLDMRMDPGNNTLNAAEVINTYNEHDLARILRVYGEEKFASQIAREIVRRREQNRSKPPANLSRSSRRVSRLPPSAWRTPGQENFPGHSHRGQSRARCAERGLDAATRWLNPGGRILRHLVSLARGPYRKEPLKEMSQGCTCPPEIPVCVCGDVPILKVITRKPLVAQPDEVERNPRARSAKIRVAQRL